MVGMSFTLMDTHTGNIVGSHPTREAAVETPRSKSSNAGVARLREAPSTRNATVVAPVRD